jgi:hypothetical protein
VPGWLTLLIVVVAYIAVMKWLLPACGVET